jgi:hypothetical protein
MKYKVLLYHDISGVESDYGTASFTFYTRVSAELACTRWVSLGVYYQAKMWDGSVWTTY